MVERILVLNVHSAQNLGDDGIMAATLNMLHRLFPSAKLTIAATDPESWAKYTNEAIVGSLTTWVLDRTGGAWRWRKGRMIAYGLLLLVVGFVFWMSNKRFVLGTEEQRKLLCAYYDADLVLSCGGGNFYADRKVSPGYLWSLWALVFAVLSRKRIVMLPQSFGPVAGYFQRFATRLMLNRVEHIFVREAKSYDFLKEIAVSVPVEVVPDLAFALGPVEFPGGLKVSRDANFNVGVTVIDRASQLASFSQQDNYERALSDVLVRLASRGVAIHVFVQCYGPSADQDDRPAARRLFDLVAQHTQCVQFHDGYRTASELRAEYQTMDCIIGSRMHSAVFAFTVGVPAMLIAYQPKAHGMMEMFGLGEYCIDIDKVSARELIDHITVILSDLEQYKALVAEKKVAVMNKLERINVYLKEIQ